MDRLPSELVIKVVDHLNADDLGLFASTSGGLYAVSKTNAMERAKVVVSGCERANTDLVDKVESSKFQTNLIIFDAGARKARLECYANKCENWLAIIERVMDYEEEFNDCTSQLHKSYHFKNIIAKNKLKNVEDIICFAAAGNELSGLDVVSEVEDSDEDMDESDVQGNDD